MAIDLKLEVADLNELSEETDDLLRALEGVPWDLDLLRALTRAGFDAANARGDAAIREEFHGAVIGFWAKRADEVDEEEAALMPRLDAEERKCLYARAAFDISVDSLNAHIESAATKGGGGLDREKVMLHFEELKNYVEFFEAIGWGEDEEVTQPDAKRHPGFRLALDQMERSVRDEFPDNLKLADSTIEKLVDGAEGGQFADPGDPGRDLGDELLEQLWHIRRVKGRLEDELA